MFSELARGKCNLDGTLNMFEVDGSRLKSAGIKSSRSRTTQLRPSTSVSNKTRLTTATRSLPYEQSFLEDNQLILPKTYLTRTGDLVLFAVVDDELFALVDSSTHGSTESLYGNDFQEGKVELLSQFSTLENFVLSVLDYKHKKEKILYASSHKKISVPRYIPSITKKDNSNTLSKKEKEIQKHPLIELPGRKLDATANTDDDALDVRCVADELQDENNNDKGTRLDLKEHSESLSLARSSKVAIGGKLRSPLIERKNMHMRENHETPKEYIEFHTQLPHKQSSSNDLTNLRGSTRPEYSSSSNLAGLRRDDVGSKQALFGDATASLSSEFVPNSVRYILNNLQDSQSTTTEKNEWNRNGQKQSKFAAAANDGIISNSTLMPFIFDGKAGRSKSFSALTTSRRGSFLLNQGRLRSASLKDLANVNLHPRISSSKPAPELRALGVTPSAVKISQTDFKRILSATQDALNENRILPNADDHKMDGSLLANIKGTEEGTTTVDQEVFWREGSFLSIEEAEKKLALVSSANNGDAPQSSKWANNRNSVCSGSSEDLDDGEDKILFSYIRSRFRKGSWNPMSSFSYDDVDGEISKRRPVSNADDSRNRDPNPTPRSDRDILNTEHKLTSSRTQSFRETVKNANSPSDKQQVKKSNSYAGSAKNLSHVAAAEVSQHNLLRALSLDGSRPSSRASTNEELDASLSIRPLSPSTRLPTPESAAELRLVTTEHQQASKLRSGIEGASLPDSAKLNTPTNSVANGQSAPSSPANQQHESTTNSANQRAIRNRLANEENSDQTSRINFSNTSPSQDFNRESTFASNPATTVSVIASIPDVDLLNIDGHASRITPPEPRSSEAVMRANSGSLTPGLTTAQDQIAYEEHVDINAENQSSKNILLFTEQQQVEQLTEMVPYDISDRKSTIVQSEGLVVDPGLKNQSKSRSSVDPIKKKTQPTHNTVFIENDVFGSRQLFSDKKSSANNVTGLDIVKEEDLKMDGLSYEQQLVFGSGEGSSLGLPGVGLHENTVKAERSQSQKRLDKQGLKIDLKMTKTLNESTMIFDGKKPALPKPPISDRPNTAEQSGLRLDGFGGDPNDDDSRNLEEIKVLIEKNKVSVDITKPKKQTERATRKKGTHRPGKKRTPSSRKENAEKKSSAKGDFSPLPELPKRMQTVETMIGGPIESEQIIHLDLDDSEDYKIVREEPIESNPEFEDPSTDITSVKIQNVEVSKVSDMEPDKKGAYPPSKTKRGKKTKKILKKSATESKRSEERLKYEEQMRFLKEKEIEQQRARETAMAKQKALEEEKMRYQEEEENAKKMEEEARLRLAEAKVKAKEDREAKRLADAEKRRQLVEQRREERRQKDLELAEKEKAAERLKHEREKRAIELRDQKERLKEQERLEEEQLLELERQEALQREEEEKRLEEERIRKAQEELEKLVEEREYREQLRRVAEAQQAKMREMEEERLLEELKEKKRIVEERDRLKRSEYLKLQAELERQKESERIAEGQRKLASMKASKRKAELLERRQQNLDRMFDLKSKRESQGISRSFTFTYFVHIPRSVWELPVGWNKKAGSSRKDRPTSTSTAIRSIK